METRRHHRIQHLIQALQHSDKIHLKDAATLLAVSEMTIRRDLSITGGPLVLLGGYIVLEPRSSVRQYLLSDQKTLQINEKRQAAKLAAQLIHPCQTVFFDCGTTTPWIIDALDMDLEFTGVCYSLNIFLILKNKPRCRVILCGGEFHASSATFKPVSFQSCLGNICPDIAFFSAGGIHPHYGVTCFSLDELPVKQWALANARQRILVVDSSKFGQVRAVCMGPLTTFDTIVSNESPAADLLNYAATENIPFIW